MKIQLRLTLWFTIILFLIFLVFSIVVYFGLDYSLTVALDRNLQREANQIIEAIHLRQPDEFIDTTVDFDINRQSIKSGELSLDYIPEEAVYWRVLDESGQTLFDPGHFKVTLLDAMAAKAADAYFDYSILADNTLVRRYTVPFTVEHKALVIQIGESYQYITDIHQQLLLLLSVSIPLVSLAAGIGGWFLIGKALLPLDSIIRSVQHITIYDLHQRLNLNLPEDELGRLTTTFNQMLDRLENSFEWQKRFIADASHEMRTPLTILKGNVEVALNRPRSSQEYQETLKMVNQTTDHLTILVEDLFLLARVDNHQYALQVEPLDLAKLLMSEVARLQPQAIKKSIGLNLDVPDGLPMNGDPNKLARLFTNLIDNAVKYSKPGDKVDIFTANDNNFVYVTVKDTGPGILPEHLPYLFDRFYRVNKARSRQDSMSNKTSGAGLGLSIAQWLAKIHGGDIDVSSRVGQGTIFIVRLSFNPPEKLMLSGSSR